MISFTTEGHFDKTTTHLKKLLHLDTERMLHKYGQMGVEALSAATPKRTGTTAASWGYKIVHNPGARWKLIWTNSNAPYGQPVAFLIQYGHVTRDGGYIPGVDYINPALEPVFNDLRKHLEGEIRST